MSANGMKVKRENHVAQMRVEYDFGGTNGDA